MSSIRVSSRFPALLFTAAAFAFFTSQLRAASGPVIHYETPGDNQVSIEIFDKQGMPIKNLQYPTEQKAGHYTATWDGSDNLSQKAPPGDYECRVELNPAEYITRGEIGNTSKVMGQQWPLVGGKANPSDVESMAVDAAGNIYTADNWDEGGQDFRKWDRETGSYLMDAQYEIRNGNPNALPYAIAVDDKYIYCSTFSHVLHAQSHIRRFNLSDGKPAPFPDGTGISNGHILVHDDPAKEIPAGTPPDIASSMRQPLKAIAVADGKLFVADFLSNKIRIFDKSSGAAQDSFDVKMPRAIAVDSFHRLWIGHENGRLGVFSEDGKQTTDVATDLAQVVALALGPKNSLYVADGAANKILIYQIDPAQSAVKLVRTFGQPAAPGDYAADHFYQLKALAVDTKGYLTVGQNLTSVGCRVTRFTPKGDDTVWDQVSGEFCSTCNYSQGRPDDVFSHYFHHYKVDKKTGAFQFRGCALATDPSYVNEQHSPMRILNFHGQEFAFVSYGTGQQVYRREGETFHLCSMFGAGSPCPDGDFADLPGHARPVGFWSWHDINGDGKVKDKEVTWQVKPDPSFHFSNMGINTDNQGNAIFANDDGDIKEVPMTGFDGKGNPIYDLSKMRVLVTHDVSAKPMLTGARMAVRADDGSIYVDYQSQVYPAPPEAGGGWMTGWMLARYDKDGKLLWYTRMPETCTGMDFVPGGGVMLITIKYSDHGTPIYHYDTSGMLIGIVNPSPTVLGFSANTDNTGALALSRDPRDGLVDMFAEDCVGNRIRWQRMDDSQKPRVFRTRLRIKDAASAPTLVSGN